MLNVIVIPGNDMNIPIVILSLLQFNYVFFRRENMDYESVLFLNQYDTLIKIFMFELNLSLS